jgi:mannosyltransferase OCH1-like enzyme
MQDPVLTVSDIQIPRVSCLCITKNKYELLEQSIDCYLFQSHPNKELVLVYESDNRPTIQRIKARYAKEESIKYVEIPVHPKLTLGALRNISVEKASGEYITQWDDDDMYHPDRIRMQLGLAIKNKKDGNIVSCVVIYDKKLRRSFLFNNYKFDGSLFVRKQTFRDKSIKYPNWKQGEDNIVRNALLDEGCIEPIQIPFLYLYRYHSNNTWDEGHFHGLYQRSTPLNTRLAAAANFVADKQFLKIALQSIAMGKDAVFPRTIPKIFHQTWKTSELPPQTAELTAVWKSLHPDWTYKLWTDEECNEFVSSVYPEFEKKYKSFPYNIQRVDAVRYLILHTYGGVYMDLDMFPLKSLDWLTSKTEFVVSKEPEEAAKIHGFPYIISNAFMASPVDHPFLAHLVEDMATHRSNFKDHTNHTLDTTGTFFMTRVYKKHPEDVLLLHNSYFMPLSYKQVDECLTLQDAQSFHKDSYDAYAVHLFEGSWWRKTKMNVNYLQSLPVPSGSSPIPSGSSPIPKIIHLISDTINQATVLKMKGLHPDWQIRLWKEEGMAAFMKEKGTPEQIEVFAARKSEFFRYFLLYTLGGVYLDMNVDLERSFEELPSYVSAFFPCQKILTENQMKEMNLTSSVWLGNYAMGCIAEHPFFKYVIDNLSPYVSLSTAYADYANKTKTTTGCTILYPVPTSSYAGVAWDQVGSFGSLAR